MICNHQPLSSSKVVLFVLTIMTFILGTVSYLSYYNRETKLVKSQFNSIKNQFSFGIKREIENRKNCLTTMATYFETEYPNASNWPNAAVPVPMDTYKRLSDPLQDISRLRSVQLVPFVKPHEIESFENATYAHFENEGKKDLGVSDFGKGIFIFKDGVKTREVDGSSSKGRYNMLTPILHVGNLKQNSNIVMLNGYTETMRASTIDYAIDNCTRGDKKCFAATDFIYIAQDSYYRPACLINHPVYATDTVTGKNITTGLVVGVFNWDTVFEDSVPTSNTEGIEARVTSDSGEENVFSFKNGLPVHKSKRSSRPVYDSVSVFVGLDRTSYTIKLVFTEEFVSQYSSGYSMAIVTVVTVLAFLSLAFIWHDMVMSRQKRNNDLVLDTKRLFVRYISHEIRTPLNTVHLGLQTLHEEVLTLCRPQSNQDSDDGSLQSIKSKEEFMDLLTDWANFIAHIDESTDDAIKVVSDLIDFDKLNTGMLNIEKGIHEIIPLICDTVGPFKIQGRSKNIVIDDSKLLLNELDAKFSSLVVFADIIKLQQVIRNLISNAMKFTPEEGVVKIIATWEVEVSSSGHSPNNKHEHTGSCQYENMPGGYTACGCIVVKVKDSGAGMTSEQVGQLFQEGVQFDANELQKGQGSGLGLWISKAVVDKHFGILRATSEGKGLGSEFTLELPVFCPIEKFNTPSSYPNRDLSGGSTLETTIDINVDPEIEVKGSVEVDTSRSITQSASPQSPSSEVGSTNISPREGSLNRGVTTSRSLDNMINKKILVVDDTSSTRRVMCRLLKNCGCSTVEAADGKEGISIFTASISEAAKLEHIQGFDMILMDYEMPVMNGPEATAKLRELGCKVPIIGVTGNVMKEDTDYFLSKGVNEVISKPVSLGKLKEVISRSLDKKPMQLKDLEDEETSNRSLRVSSLESLGRSTSSIILPPLSFDRNSEISTNRNVLVVDDATATDEISTNRNVLVVDDATATDEISTNRKVLVVDDVASTRKVMCRFLSRCNCDTIQAGDGKECIDIVLASKDHPFDLILMDYEMPVMNGPEATAKLRELGCKIPIIGVTGNVMEKDINHFMSQGALEVIHKPLDTKKIHHILGTWTKEPISTVTPTTLKKRINEVEKLNVSSHTSGDVKTDLETSNISKPPKSKNGNDNGEDWYMMALNL